MTTVVPAAPPMEGARADGRGRRHGLRFPALGVLPFFAYFAVFLGIPTVAVLWGAFRGSGGFTFSNISATFHDPYLQGYENDLKLAAVTSVIPGIIGFVVAYAVHVSPRGNVLRRVIATASGVFANFGGVPLAFLFTATFGFTTSALANDYLTKVGIHIHVNVHDLLGIELVYGYFQIPLMVLVITPALAALRPAWREASDNLGAGPLTFWTRVGIPVLFPSFLSGVLLLFGSALSAYATADALTGGSIALTSIQIGNIVNGNAGFGSEAIAKALSFGLIVMIAVIMVLYALVQRRFSRWLR